MTIARRWQEQMEDHLAGVRENAGMLRQASSLPEARSQAFATAALANSIAALALSIANTGGDVELALSRLADAVGT